MDTLTYLRTKWSVHDEARSPVEVPNFGRDQLAELFFALEFRRGVEVGVERAKYSEVLLRANHGLHLTCVDPWKAYRGYRDHVSQEKLDGFFIEAQARLAPFARRVTFLRQFSVDAARTFADASLDFVYLDGNHSFQSLTADLAAWTPKIRAGGIIGGHDYVKLRYPNQGHVVQVIHGWTDAYGIGPWFVLGAHAKDTGQIRDDARSWLWVHEPRPVYKGRRPIKQ